jgi:hypothetical protein
VNRLQPLHEAGGSIWLDTLSRALLETGEFERLTRKAPVRIPADRTLGDAFAAGTVAALVSGTPSTVHALLAGARPLDASLAAGTLLLPRERRPGRLLLAAVPVHLALSLGWALVLALLLPRRRTACFGALAGLAIAALDLGVIGRRFERIRGLPQIPQVADHLAYGATVGAVLSIRRSSRR